MLLRQTLGWVLLALCVAGAIYSFIKESEPCPNCGPQTPNVQPQPPAPQPPPPNPRRPRCPCGTWGAVGTPLSNLFQVTVAGPLSPNGTPVQVDLPLSQRIKNIGSHRDGAGMCVMSSIEMVFRWEGVETMRGLRDWCAEQPGGGTPQKTDEQIKAYCQERHVELPPYFQLESRSKDLTLLRLSLNSWRPVAVTYDGHDQVRYRQSIAHMVLLIHMDDQYVGILDNNYVGENEILWMTVREFTDRWSGWAVFCTAPPPPPVPH